MHVMALTGGIASGKSTVCRHLREFLPQVVIFDCDAAVHRLLESDPEVAGVIRRLGYEPVWKDWDAALSE